MYTFFNSIDEYVKTEMERLGIPGLALGIVHGNEVVHLLGLGAAHKGFWQPG
jgi:hypothetical protein